MSKRRQPLLRIAAAVITLAFCMGAAVAQNIHPDPSFEQTGVPGVARTGEKAGYLKVGARDHWSAIGGKIAVEPFARYRVTQWVKARIGAGNFFAPYCYEWNNYEWSFVSSRAIQTMDDWTQTEVTFVSPHDTMYVHPLAYIGAENCEAWVDDIVVEKIAEPTEVMAELAARANPSGAERQLLARWHVAQGDMEAAGALLAQADGLTRTDIACLLAQHTPDLAARRPFVVEMVAYGGPTYHGGLQRFDEITVGMSEEDRLGVCAEAVVMNPGLDRAGRSLRVILERAAGVSDSLMTIAEATANVARLRGVIQGALAAVPADSPSAKELQTAMQIADDAERELEARRAALGSCVVIIGGRAVSPETHAVVIPDEPTPQEQHAARDLRHHLELITGHALPVWYEKDLGDRTPLAVGRCEFAAEIDFEGLGIEAIHIKTDGPALMLAGNRRGVLYATYTFLEDYLGCRWFAPDCSTWPTQGTIEVAEIDHRYLPPLEYRATDYPSSRPGDFAVRNKYNGTIHSLDQARGGKISYRGFVHTFNSLVPPERYYEEHPEYYSEINANRIGPGHTQLCLTNPDVLRIATETVRRWIRESPEATIISVSQNDWHNYCQCAECNALAEHEGSQSGPLLHFVNAIADAIADEHPHIIIDTLAYQYTRKPPRHVRPRPNVAVRLCSIECCFIHPLETDPFNSSFVDDIIGWNEICDRLHIWDYVINYAHSICPFPNLYVLGPNIRFFINHGVTGIYEEACYYSKGSELQELRSYVMAKLLWDPDYDTDRAIDEFCAGYYGAAAPFIREYLNLIHESVQDDPDLHVRIYTHPRQYVKPEVIEQSKALFDRAEAAVADDATLLHRVEVARLPIIYAEITLATGGAFAERGDRLVQEGGTDVTALAERFERIARAEGVARVREGGPLATLDAWLESIPRRDKEVQIQRLRTPTLEAAVLPELGGRIWRLRLLPMGLDLLNLHGEEDAWLPDAGGYEEYSEAGYRSPGWSEAYTVTERSESAISLQADLRNGLRLRRAIELDPEAATVRVTSTLTNTSNTARRACLRVHPEFAVTSTQEASVRVLGSDGEWRTHSLADAEDPQAEREMWLDGAARPAGAWEVVDEKAAVTIRNVLPAEQIGRALLNWSGRLSRVNLEVFSPEVNLEPGASISMEMVYEVEVG